MQNSKNVPFYLFGKGAANELGGLLEKRRTKPGDVTVFLIDSFFLESPVARALPVAPNDLVFYVSTEKEPTTDSVNKTYLEVRKVTGDLPVAVVGVGGGCTLDTAKAVSNLLTNGGQAEDYQGYDLVRVPGVYKIGVPTLSGTGSETSRTCVMTNKKKNLKLGMNSEFTMFDQLVLDPELPVTVPRDQYFYTGMDTYIHCIESLNGHHRHQIGDAFSHEALSLCRKVFGGGNMQDYENREALMVASYLGGCAIANSYVGLVHPLSAALSTVLETHHCIGNCIVMNVMDDYYPDETAEFRSFLKRQKIDLPRNITANLTEEEFGRLYESTMIYDMSLSNALGKDFRDVLTKEKAIRLFRMM